MESNEIRKWHDTFKRDGELFEIRILADKTHTYSGYFNDVEAAIKQLEHFDNANIYYSVNEVKNACASREQFGQIRQVSGTATSKNDIEHRWWLPIDIDCERPSGISSTNAEKELAHKKAQAVFVFLRQNSFVDPVVCDSSSGYHILYPIDMDNTQESEDAIKTFLEILSSNFTDESVKIDTVLHDANRILRLPGTYGRKGRSTEERPHRLARILSAPNVTRRMTCAQIRAFNEKYSIKTELPQRRSYNANTPHTDFNLREFIKKYGIRVAKEVPISGGGTKYILEECPFDPQHKAPDSAIFEMPNGSIAFKCFHNSCSQHDWRALRLLYDPHAYDYETQQWNGNTQQTQRLNLRQKPKHEIKDEIPELGSKWLTMSSIPKVDILNIERYKTGYVQLDNSILGLAAGEVTLLSGGNASGKSSWLNSLILNIINQNTKCALWSGELPAPILNAWIQMVAAGKANMRQSQYKNGKYFVPESVSVRINQWTEDKLFIYNNEYGNTWEQIFHDMKTLVKAGVKVFVLDNLMSLNIDLLADDKNGQQRALILQIKEFAKHEKVHIILVAHPRKSQAFLRKNDISGTSDLTNVVDNVFIIHRVNNDFLRLGEEYFGKGSMEKFSGFGNVLEVCKNRMFGIVDLFVGMHYEQESRRFKNTLDEQIHYGWESIQTQTEAAFAYEQASDMTNISTNTTPSMPFSPTTEEAAPF